MRLAPIWNLIFLFFQIIKTNHRARIEEYREMGDYAKDSYSNFEHVAFEMVKIKVMKDPSYKGSTSVFTTKDYEKAFTK